MVHVADGSAGGDGGLDRAAVFLGFAEKLLGLVVVRDRFEFFRGLGVSN